jgi:hypothetical protein
MDETLVGKPHDQSLKRTSALSRTRRLAQVR